MTSPENLIAVVFTVIFNLKKYVILGLKILSRIENAPECTA